MARRSAPPSYLFLQSLSHSKLEVEVQKSSVIPRGKVVILINENEEITLKKMMEEIFKSEKAFSTLGKFGVVSATVENMAYLSPFAASVIKHGLPNMLAVVSGKLDPISSSKVATELKSLNENMAMLQRKMGNGAKANGGAGDHQGAYQETKRKVDVEAENGGDEGTDGEVGGDPENGEVEGINRKMGVELENDGNGDE